ncbi:MAG: NAD-dependent epimerase/dehydratase family protein [Magnetococcus sp. YQC-3]
MIGKLNKRVRLIESIFVAYPASHDYLSYYYYDWMARISRSTRKLYIGGLFVQDGRIIIGFGVGFFEDDFLDHDSKEALSLLLDETRRVKNLLNVRQYTFSGVLPGVLFVKRLRKDVPELATTLSAVLKAEYVVRVKELLPESTPVVVLGGEGFIGRKVVSKLREMNREVHSVDILGSNTFPSDLRGQRIILLNVTKKAALTEYLGLLWNDVVILNEVYPEPAPCEVMQIRGIGCKIYHIVGIKAFSVPSFPGAYNGGIPCCAALDVESMEVLIKELM